MMAMLWVVLLVALTGSRVGDSSPVRSTPQVYSHETNGHAVDIWGSEGGLHVALPALALVVTAVALFFGCTWCYGHKDCKLFTASAVHLHDGRRAHPPDSGFSEPANNNISEDNNNGPISLREMQNIANNNAAAYIVSENEERNRISRESVVEFEPLPTGIRVADPLEHCADWFGGEDFPRNQLQYLREIGRGWFGRVVEGEIDDAGTSRTVAVKILNQNATLEDKARFLDESRVYRDLRHENLLAFIAKCLQEDPWILLFELCSMDLQQYLIVNQPKMAILNEGGVPLRLMCDVTSALSYMHSRGYIYGSVWCGSVLVRGAAEAARAVLGRYAACEPPRDLTPPETRSHPHRYTAHSDVWYAGGLVWSVCAWGATPAHQPPPPPDLPCPYRNHLYQVMQLCWQPNPEARPTAPQVHALINHLYITHRDATETCHDDGYGSSDFEERWQRLKPNTIPKLDEHIAIVHAPSTSMASHFTGSDQEFDNQHTVQDSLSVDMDTAVSRSSSIMSDKEPLSIQIKSESLTNLHGSLEDVRNIYLTHNETATLECHQGNMSLEDAKEKELDRSDGSVDPWLKDIIAGSQDDVSYYKDVSDVIKNLDNILNSEKTSSSESSHQASPSRDTLSLDCKTDYPMQSSMVKSPGIINFQNILDNGFNDRKQENEYCEDDDADRDTIGTLSHSFERHSEIDTLSQHTLENLTPETPIKDIDILGILESHAEDVQDSELPKEIVYSNSTIPKLMELCVASIPRASDKKYLNVRKDCQTSCDSILNDIRTDIKEKTKSLGDIEKWIEHAPHAVLGNKESISTIDHIENSEDLILPEMLEGISNKEEECSKNSKFPCTIILQKSDYNPTFVQETVRSDSVEVSKSPMNSLLDLNILEITNTFIHEEKEKSSDFPMPSEQIPEVVQNINNIKIIPNTNNLEVTQETETPTPTINHIKPMPKLPSEIVQNITKERERDETNIILDDNNTNMEHIDNIRERIEDLENSFEDTVKLGGSNISDTMFEPTTQIGNTEFSNFNLLPSVDRNIGSSLISDEIKDLFIDNNKMSLEKITELKNETLDAVTANNKIEPEILHEVTKTNHVLSSKIYQDSPVVEEIEEMKYLDDINDINLGSMNIIGLTTQAINDANASTSSIVPENNEIDVNYLIKESDSISNKDTVCSANHTHEGTLWDNGEPKVALNKCETFVIDKKELSMSTKPATVELLEKELPLTGAVSTLTEESIKTQYHTSLDIEILPSAEKTKDEHKIINNTKSDFLIDANERSDSTVYMDLCNDTNKGTVSVTTIDNNFSDVNYLETLNIGRNNTFPVDESTEYLDLPSFRTKDIENFLHNEKMFNSNNIDIMLISSTPLTSDTSVEANVTVDKSTIDVMSETKVPHYGPGVFLTKLEQKYVPENMSPYESPTKSHHTDTYDENSSVVLGPFENCTIELFKAVKSTELVEIPKEELLAFSSNFSEINLETPSPLRDGNFLNEVPDIVHDEQLDDSRFLSEKPSQSDTDSGKSATEKHISPSTPPNSPGVFLASTSNQIYLVDIDLTTEVQDPDQSLQKEIELNQIELQITTKLAMAENENNQNLEYSGPLTMEGLVSEGVMLGDTLPESYLAGNGGSAENLREDLTLDEECVKALRNELELKLPLAQVAAIEPPIENEWPSELPPPPELVVNYPGALSPIAEETGQQLSAYENDINWNASSRTQSSESYPEPCNNSTDEATELRSGAHDPSVSSAHHTYTVHRDRHSTTEITMSADSLNASPHKKNIPHTETPIDDKTYTKSDEEKESNCERISQVSPFLLSPITDTSALENSDNIDNATGISTLSKTTLPTDAKLSKPSETQCLSKATSIDSWCSNDTLYNVEETFDDLAMDPDIEYEAEKKDGNSDSTDTLTHNEDNKEASHGSTYIIHDSKSDVCESFSSDSITANGHHTYTKVKTDAGTTPPATKSELNDSTKNTTKDLAYGTLISGLSCTTEVMSGDDWRIARPEMVRQAISDNVDESLPELTDDKESVNIIPTLTSKPCVKKMDSVDISCLQDLFEDSHNNTKAENQSPLIQIDSPNSNYKTMAPSVTSTPFTELPIDVEDVIAIPMKLPGVSSETSDNSVPNFQIFLQSAEVRPQDLSSNMSKEYCNKDEEILLEGDSKTCSRNSHRDSVAVSERTPTYSDFENSATSKPQDLYSRNKPSQNIESGISSEDFKKFENSIKSRPQDLSSLIDASSLLLKSERMSSEFAIDSTRIDHAETISSISHVDEPQSHFINPPNVTNLEESHSLVNFRDPCDAFLVSFDDDETEQPHSIIITETTMNMIKESPNRTYNSHSEETLLGNCTYDSHKGQSNLRDEEMLENNGDLKLNKGKNLVDTVEQESQNTEKLSNNATSTVIVEKGEQNLTTNETAENKLENSEEAQTDGSEKFATVNFLNETFEELIESNVDDAESKDIKSENNISCPEQNVPEIINSINTPGLELTESPNESKSVKNELQEVVDVVNGEINGKVLTVTQDFLQNEKKFCQMNTYFPLLSDIRFTGPATEIMSTSFTEDSPTEPTSRSCEQERRPDIAADILKEWDSDTESHTSNSSSGEFIWKGGDGHETSVVPTTHFEHHRSGGSEGGCGQGSGVSGASSGSSGSGSEGDEVEFVPSSWDCRAAPAKSSLRTLEHTTPDSKKRVVFKRQKYHCVYEYPREVHDVEHSPAAYLPDLSTYCDWDPASAEEAELGYGQLFGAPSALDLYPLRAGIAFGADYDEDFFISSSARPFESLGIMSTTSQFFPGKHVKPALLERDLSDEVVSEEFPPPPSPLATTTIIQTRTPSLDFTTPDSGVEDITPGSTTDDDFKKKLPESELTWRPVDSGSSSESVSPSSPGGEALGGLRHTRDKLKLDLPPSPHIPSPRHNRVFNFALDKPKRREDKPELGSTPLVMTDETPIVTTSLPLQKDEELPAPEPTFSTFGKSPPKIEQQQKLILDEVEQIEGDVKVESPKVVEAVKGEGTVLDSGDEDSGIESSSKATLERNKTSNVS